MSYVKTQWVNNTTPINDTNLNKIEQGIYDNSLVVDAVTNKLNPTDTETYKTAELTEGQITDVIGINDIVIKGQTSQDGEPTPSAPVDVNVVSGSNVVNTSSKNMFDKNNINSFFGYPSPSTKKLVIAGSTDKSLYIPIQSNQQYTVQKIKSSRFYIGTCKNISNGVDVTNAIANNNATQLSITSGVDDEYLVVCYFLNGTETNEQSILNSIQIEQGSTPTTYEPHQGKELPLDLPVENLLNMTNGTYTQANVTAVVNNGVVTLSGTSNATTFLSIPLNNTLDLIGAFTLSLNNNNTIKGTGYNVLRIAKNDTTTLFEASAMTSNSKSTISNANEANCRVILRLESGSNCNGVVLIPQLEKGSKANAYTPYGTDPIELCKIGDYQDYFYKSGSKWYLHKEINKDVSDGNIDEDWQINPGYSNVFFKTKPSDLSTKETRMICNMTTYFESNYYATQKYVVAIGGALNFKNADISTVEDLKIFLSANNLILYYLSSEPQNIEITDTTLISQLEAIYNAPLYEETNITQTNNDLPMVLDITACKDNINGIKAFIRK